MTVLIAGAGPVDLSAASVLAAAGVPVTVLEAEPRLPENLRASTFQPPTLDLLARFGATDEWYFLLRVHDVWRAMFPTRAEESEADILSDGSIERRLQRVHAKAG